MRELGAPIVTEALTGMASSPSVHRFTRAAVALVITAVLFAGLIVWNPSGLYLWLKALHVIAVISWMAAMLYLPRLFVYHCEAEVGSKQSETFKVMERRLLRAIMNPAMIADLGPGPLAGPRRRLVPGALAAGEVRSGHRACPAIHGMLARSVRGFAEDQQHASR